MLQVSYLRDMARKLFARVNDRTEEIVLERSKPSSAWSIPGEEGPDLKAPGPSQFSLIREGRSHRILILKEDRENGIVRMRIGGRNYSVKLQDEQVRMMRTMGFDSATAKVSEIKAPMPGLVINVIVKAGDTVKKGDALLVLEAMKMENVIKAPADAVVSAVPAEQGKAVEKGQLLVSFQ